MCLGPSKPQNSVGRDDTKFPRGLALKSFMGDAAKPSINDTPTPWRLYQHHSHKAEPILSFDFSGLEIEHIMPQDWKKHWPLSAGKSSKIDRDRRVQGIGNLTLVTDKLNHSLSNAAWLDGPKGKKGKRSALQEHSKLQLNAKLVKNWQKAWNDATIENSATVLFEAARKIRPPPPETAVQE